MSHVSKWKARLSRAFWTPRRRRRARILATHWRRRFTFILGGVGVGAAAVVFTKLADLAQLEFNRLIGHWPYACVVVTPTGFAASIYLATRFFPNSQGSGIPQAIAARQIWNLGARDRLVSIRIAVGKVLLTVLGLLCGASVGREGPTVQVGASLMFAVGRMSPRRQPGLILAGASAGVAAAFNTPLAGIVFGIEEMGRSFETQTNGLAIAAVIAAGVTSLAFLGDYLYFGTTNVALGSFAGWIAVVVCGIAGGLAGGLFSRCLVLFSDGLPGSLGRWLRANPVLFAAICGLGVAVCGLASGGSVFGTGYLQARSLLEGSHAVPLAFGFWKLLATLLSSVSGVPGGIFSPSLAAGAGIGVGVAQLFPSVPLGAMILLGMVAYFTGVVQAPLTAFVIVTEMTADHAMVVPLMAAAFIAQAVSRLVCKEGVYHALATNYRRTVERDGG
jgi:H+/Cl- antiporter ClcA